ncbi:MAG: hypothetical protein AAB546_01220 [Patescibacteria group bacterium]
MKKILNFNFAYKKTLISFLIINLLGILAVLIIQNKLPPVVPLLYGLPKGEDQLVPKIFLTVPFAVSEIITLINIILIKTLKESFSQKALLYITVAICSLSFITVLKISLLIGSF